MPKQTSTPERVDRKPYAAPEIVFEIELETRAGSPLPTGIDPLDLTGVGDLLNP